MLTVRQIYQNHVSKSVEGLSFVFLLQWTIGDLTNFVGAFLTKQLPIQIIIAAYMLTVDLTLCAQYACTFSLCLMQCTIIKNQRNENITILSMNKHPCLSPNTDMCIGIIIYLLRDRLGAFLKTIAPNSTAPILWTHGMCTV